MATRSDECDEQMVSDQIFATPFRIDDINVFDDGTLADLLQRGVDDQTLALALHGATAGLVERVEQALLPQRRQAFVTALRQPAATDAIAAAQSKVLAAVFWELTYWQTPDLYEELTEGEHLHPGIFHRLAPELRGKVVLDAGAGSGRVTFDCLRYGARQVYAVDPSPGLLRILEHKRQREHAGAPVATLRGRFDALPLADDSVDVTLSCAAFTVEEEHGGEAGLAEMRRVTRAGGQIILIWPRPDDLPWLAAHGFHHIEVATCTDMLVHYRSLGSALRVARRFYAHNPAVSAYLLRHHRPEVPFAVLGMHPPCDYAWLRVAK